MSGLAPARAAALHALVVARERDGYIRDILRADHDVAALSARDRGLCYRLATGATAAAPVLDQLINARLSRPGRTAPRLRVALRMAAFEICYLSTPTRAAVSQGVEAARSQARSAAGMANAVLRRIAQEDAPRVASAREAVRRAAAGEGTATHEELSLASGIPVWLCERLTSELGGRDAACLCAAQLEPAGAYVQSNPLVMSDDRALDALAERGIAATPCALPGSLELAAAGGLGTSGLVDDVALVPCDLAAQMVCAVAAPSGRAKPVRMLEVGQGRATKSILVQAAAHRAGATVNVDAVELHASRVKLARERLARAGIECVTCHALDARELSCPDVLPEVHADVVLVDAPCSGTGTMRRHPEIPSTLEPSALDPVNPDSLPSLQLQILMAASTRVEPGGHLLYSTCSVMRPENEGVIEAFLASPGGAGFELLSLAGAPGMAALSAEARDAILAHEKGHGLFATVPSVGGPDGHFLACLVRR